MEGAFQADEEAGRKRRACDHLTDLGNDRCHVGFAVRVGKHHDATLAVFAQDLVGTIRLADFGYLADGDPARRCLDEEIREPLGAADIILQPQHDIEPLVAVDDAGHDRPV